MALCLLDTDILLRLVHPETARYFSIRSATEELSRRREALCYTSQNLAAFWNVCTRPAERNGFGLSIKATDILAALIENRLKRLPENLQVHHRWWKLVLEHEVSGAKVHDARLVAAMQVHGVQSLLTLNPADFARYTSIKLFSPRMFLVPETDNAYTRFLFRINVLLCCAKIRPREHYAA